MPLVVLEKHLPSLLPEGLKATDFANRYFGR